MTPRDFCYWLQGHFENREPERAKEGVSAFALSMIKKHLELVSRAKFDANRFPDANAGKSFCDFLEGFFAAHEGSELSPALTEKIRTKLNDTFVHAIDPTFSNRAELSRMHDGDGPVLGRRLGQDRDGVQAMC
ncbi:MAG: hypothetical protein JSS83_28035 [Cyanobacteria bacterium SZAS LIN-3]|nr:hypothetical protein [Cyanobacteria bacterium SZAS LIN-3]MBS2010008.1 hypothetical protein [Cyanobacteria bacterium SZAS TMP-1]